jgi:MoaD family protein
MPKIRIKYYMKFSSITGKMSEDMDIGMNETVSRLLQRLGKVYGKEFSDAFGEDLGSRSAVVAINGEFAEMGDVLSDGDEVVISFPVGGG